MPRTQRAADPADVERLCKLLNDRKPKLINGPKASVNELCPPKPKRRKRK